MELEAGLDLDALAGRIVEAIARRADDDPGMTLEQVQRLIVARVQREADEAGVSPRDLMRHVYRQWEARDRPPMLGLGETERVLASLAAKGLITLEQREMPGEPPATWLRLNHLSREEIERRWPELTHDEQVFLRGILKASNRYRDTA